MAGLIDVGILKPELAGSFAAGYRGAEQARQQSAQAEQQLAAGRQKMQMDEMTLQRLREDRAAMLQLQERLKAAGQDPDLEKVFDALASSGIPDYVMKGVEGKRRLQDQREYARIMGLSMPGAAAPTGAATPTGAVVPGVAAPTAAAPAGELVAPPIAAPTGTVQTLMPGDARGPAVPLTRESGAGLAAPEAVNALAPTVAAAAAPAAAPTNMLAARPAVAAPGAPAVAAGPNPELITQTQNKINNLLNFASTVSTPQLAQNALSQARILQDQLELYSKRGPNEPAALQELRAYMAMSPDERAAFEKLQKIKAPGTTVAVNTATGKSLAGPVGARAETSLTKAEGAAGIMESANMVREALNTGNVIAGPLAGVRTKFAQVLELAGAGDKDKLVATRTAIQGLATLTLESRAELKGQGQVTENEQKLLERARSGNIEDMTIAELQQIVNVSQRLANRLWGSHQTLLKTMSSDPAAADSLRYYQPTVTLPSAVGEGKPQAEVDKRKAGLDTIFGGKR
jgi:hypothetical protein